MIYLLAFLAYAALCLFSVWAFVSLAVEALADPEAFAERQARTLPHVDDAGRWRL